MLPLLLAACTPSTPVIQDTDGPAGAPDVTLDSTLIDFGELAVGGSATRTVTITNSGDAGLALTGLSLEDAEAGFAITALGASTLAPAGTTSFDVTFTATSTGTATTRALLATDDPDEPEVDLVLLGSAAAGALALTPASYDFGEVPIGCDDTHALELRNDGTRDLVVSAVSINGGSDAFALDSTGAGPLPWTLASGQAVQVWVSFSPATASQFSASLAITSDDPVNPRAALGIDGTGAPIDGVADTFEADGTTSFPLSALPWPDTLAVTVDGVWTTGWSYEPTTNAVVFAHAPAEGEVVITYDSIPTCN